MTALGSWVQPGSGCEAGEVEDDMSGYRNEESDEDRVEGERGNVGEDENEANPERERRPIRGYYSLDMR